MESFVKDEMFLLRCASTYNWDALIARCAVIKSIFSAAQGRVHDRMRIAAASHQLLARDQWGNTTLHIACFHSAPLQAIQILLEAARSAGIELTCLTSGDNSTPLLIACATSTDALAMLLEPPGNLNAVYPDDQGATPLSELCTRYEKKRSKTKDPPLEEATLRPGSPCFEEFWQNVVAIIRAYANSRGYLDISILHGAALMSESCPKELTHLICRSYPNIAATSDERGLLALHLAMERMSHRANNKMKEQHVEMLDCLLDIYPEAAKRRVRGGRTPFCEAIASGLDWQLPSRDGPLWKLWTCAPEALYSRDRTTGFYPFLLAASLDQHDETDDPCKLNNIYSILRLYPQVIQDMLSGSISETPSGA
jgi:ankyrin repeat protein